MQTDWNAAEGPLLDISALMPPEIKAITPLVDRLSHLVEELECLPGDHLLFRVGLREALYNTVVRCDGLHSAKSILVCCRCKRENEIYIVVKSREQELDSEGVLDLCARPAEQRAGILQTMRGKHALWFEQRGAEVHVSIRNSTRFASNVARLEADVLSPPAERGFASRPRHMEASTSSLRSGD